MKKVMFFIAAMVMLASCGVSQKDYQEKVEMIDSLRLECNQLRKDNMVLQKELDGYRYEPAKLLASIRENYASKSYGLLKKNLDLLHQYHPDAAEYATANGIYEQALRDQEAARKKEEAEAARREAERVAKMKPIERIMEKYGCSEYDAELISKRRVRIGMTDELCLAALGKPRDINRSVGSYGVHEQWCYSGLYLYFEDGVLTSFQD